MGQRHTGLQNGARNDQVPLEVDQEPLEVDQSVDQEPL